MSHAIGIDFGTTKTLVYYLQNQEAKAVGLGRNADKIPTSVFIRESGQFYFGDDADDEMEHDSTRYHRAFKLALGEKKPCLTVDVKGSRKGYTAKALTREFLKYVRTYCEREVFMGEPVSEAVITHPVNFTPARKEALNIAAHEAGFEKVTLLPEPEAAGRAFLNANPSENFNRMMIVDWGGGTVDFALVSKNAKGEIKVEPNSFDGDDTCGGEVFDERLQEYAIAQTPALQKASREEFNRMVGKVRTCKEHLSKKDEDTLRLSLSNGPCSISLARSDFEKLIRSDVEEIAEKLKKLLDKLSASPEALLMIGGSSNIPFIQTVLEKATGLKCKSWHKKHEAVAIGAALALGRTVSPAASSNVRTDAPSSAPAEDIAPPLNGTLFCAQKEMPCVPAPAEDPESLYQTGVDFYSEENYTEAVRYFQRAAEMGNSEAQCIYGSCYEYGLGVQKNVKNAVKWYRKSADQGHFVGEYCLGQCYLNGDGIPESKGDALYWLKRSALQGNVLAFRELDESDDIEKMSSKKEQDDCYDWFWQKANGGFNWAKIEIAYFHLLDENHCDYSKALTLLKPLADQGDAVAQFLLGMCYCDGRGVAQNYKEAVKWFRKSADQGNATALCELGDYYFDGFGGVPAKRAEAYNCFMSAAKQCSAGGWRLFSRFGECHTNATRRCRNEMMAILCQYRSIKYLFLAPNFPNDKLNNALTTYGVNVPLNSILAFHEKTVFGGGEDGYILTCRGIKGHNKDESILDYDWENITTVEYSENAVLINGELLEVWSNPAQHANMILAL